MRHDTVFSHRGATNGDRAVTPFGLSMRDTSHAAVCYERVYGALSMDARDSAGPIPWKWPVQAWQEFADHAESKEHRFYRVLSSGRARRLHTVLPSYILHLEVHFVCATSSSSSDFG